MRQRTEPAAGPDRQAAPGANVIGLLLAMPPIEKLDFARWCRDTDLPSAVRGPASGSPEEAAAIAALEAGIEDLGSSITPEIHAFFDPEYGEWSAWRAGRSAVAALARTAASDNSGVGDLAPVLARLGGGPANHP